MNYKDYIAEEFAANESFQDYYLHCDKEAAFFWTKWIETHPNKQQEIMEAKQLLDVFKSEISDQEINTNFSALKKKIDNSPTPPKAKILSTSSRKRFLKLASIAAVLLAFCGTTLFLWPKPNIELAMRSTEFGELKDITLPDGSHVYLNSNSTINFNKEWTKHDPREIWLDGEAFFDVTNKPTKGAKQFIVHANGNKIKVLGTSFNIYNRNKKLAVVLENGKVDIIYKKQNKEQLQRLLPGESFEINAQQQSRHYQNINTALYTAWKEQTLILQDTPLKKVVNILKENFGFEVTVKNKKILDRKLTTTVPIKDIDILLDALREIYDLKIKKENNKISIE